MGAALALGERARGRTAPNPNVGCVIVSQGRVIGRGWTRAGGRPHAEAGALAQAGTASRGATAYVTLEPCAHQSPRGPACSALLVEAGVARVMIALGDPDPRTNGAGIERLRAAGVVVRTGMRAAEAAASMTGFLTRQRLGRPMVTLKLATSLDGCIALADGASRWITGPEARAHAHLERSRHEAILVGRGTYEADAPRLDVRLAGLEARSPIRVMLTQRSDGAAGGPSLRQGDGIREGGPRDAAAPERDHCERWDLIEAGTEVAPGQGGEWITIAAPEAIADLPAVDHLLVEGGAQTAAAFLRAGLVDRLLLYRAPILIGSGLPALRDIGLRDLGAAHGRWRLEDARQLGSDRMEVYGHRPCSQG